MTLKNMNLQREPEPGIRAKLSGKLLLLNVKSLTRAVRKPHRGKGAVRSGSVEKIATADTKWKRTREKKEKKENETSNWIPRDRMKQEGRASLHALQCKHCLCNAVVCRHNCNAGVLGFGGQRSAFCHPLL